MFCVCVCKCKDCSRYVWTVGTTSHKFDYILIKYTHGIFFLFFFFFCVCFEKASFVVNMGTATSYVNHKHPHFIQHILYIHTYMWCGVSCRRRRCGDIKLNIMYQEPVVRFKLYGNVCDWVALASPVGTPQNTNKTEKCKHILSPWMV